jgi:hypothetical protein
MNLYLRYLFPDFLLDASKGSLFERAAALRSNVEKRNYLLSYARRWFVLSIAGILGYMAFDALRCDFMTALFGVAMVLCDVAAWIFLVLWALLLWESNK